MFSTVKKSCVQCNSKYCLINRSCNDEWKNKFDQDKGVNIYRKGEYIFREGFPNVGVYIINSGMVKLVSMVDYGKEYVVRFAKDGHLLGHLSSDSDKYTVDAVTMEDSVICFLKTEMFRAASNHNKDMLYELMMYYSCELRKSEIRSRNIALMNVRERVAHSLLLMLNVSGENTEDGKLKLDLKISGTDLAKVAGTTPEEICRTMAAFKKLGLISVEKKSIFIRNREKLQGIIDKYSPEWKCCEKPY